MKTIQITSEIVRGSFESQFTICEAVGGVRDGFEEITVQHDSTDPMGDAADIDAHMEALAKERGAVYV